MSRSILLLLVALAAVGCAPKSAPGPALPTLSDLDGGRVDLADHAGQVVLINRWASWCGPCRDEIPELVRLGHEHADDGLVVYGLNDEAPEIQRAAARRFDIDYPLLVEPPPASLPEAMKPSGYVPETILIGRDGSIRESFVGYADPATLEAKVQALLAADRS